MPLKMRPTGLGHGVYKDNVDYSADCATLLAETVSAAKATGRGGVEKGGMEPFRRHIVSQNRAGLLKIAGMMLPIPMEALIMGSVHPTWYERATPDEIEEIAKIDRAIADLRRRRSMLVNRTKMRTQVWVDHHRPSTERRARRR
jgi:hypothetical protein